MSEHRTPDEKHATQEQDARIQAVLDRAVHDGASYKLAYALGEPEDVLERWTDIIFDGLRDGLSDTGNKHSTLRLEDRLAAIVLLLDERMQQEADRLREAMGGVL